MTAEQLAKSLADEYYSDPMRSKSELVEIATKHIEKIFRMAEATIRDQLSKARVCDD